MALHFTMNYIIKDKYYFEISTIIWIIQFFSHLSTALLNPGIPSRRNYLPDFKKENNIDLTKKNNDYKICKICNIIVNEKDNVCHCEDCDICIIGIFILF
jgi:hypothetical protein